MKPSRPTHPRIACLCLACAGLLTLANGATVTLTPIKDNTILSELTDNSNGGGSLFTGRTNLSGGIRRALVQFDIAGNIPAGAVINSITVSFVQTRIGAGASATFELHRLLQTWGEGGAVGTGSGAAAGSGDATWTSAAHGSTLWTTAGGNFAAASGSAVFGSTNTTYTFASSTGLVADVQGWLNSPSTNFGWLLGAADESFINSRQLGSRESPSAQRPQLSIDYSPVPEPTTTGMAASMLLLGCGWRHRTRIRH